MIAGAVSAYREPIIRLDARGPKGMQSFEAVVDTGFSDYLTMSRQTIGDLGLRYLGPTKAELADGSEVIADLYRAEALWNGRYIAIDVVAAEGPPLVGMAMMYGYNLSVDVLDGGRVILDLLP